jgi:hypothetical protein
MNLAAAATIGKKILRRGLSRSRLRRCKGVREVRAASIRANALFYN